MLSNRFHYYQTCFLDLGYLDFTKWTFISLAQFYASFYLVLKVQ